MKKIIVSLSIIAVVATVAVGATRSYFSDTQTSTNNIIQTGTVDINIDGNNPWIGQYTMGNMEPGDSRDVNFVIHNTGTYPVDVWKKLTNLITDTGTQSEPECRAENGTWDNISKICTGMTTEDNAIDKVIDYSLKVELYRGNTNEKIWDQIIYDGNYTINQIKDSDMILGMIPAGDYMKVYQTYKFDTSAGNQYQGDKMTFDIKVIAQQLTGTAVLENKNTSGDWAIIHDDSIQAIFNYTLKGPEFGYNLIGKAPLGNTSYVLAIGYNSGTNVDTYIDEATTDANGNISFSGSRNLGKDMINVKAWLIPKTDWSSGGVSGWGDMDKWLWETGLIQYEYTTSGSVSILADPTMLQAPNNNPPTATSMTINDPGGDINNQYGYQFNYSGANVTFTYNTPASGKLTGTINATGLKPYATYQVKFVGDSTNVAMNEAVGYKGRWSCVSGATCAGDGVARNRTDAQYEANKALADSNPNKEVIVGYLVWDFFTADASGNATKVVQTANSYHVLWSGGGTCNTNANNYLADLDSAHSTVLFSPADKVDGEIERGTCGGLTLNPGAYNLKMALTEESFHQGNWATVLQKDINFTIN